MKKLLILTSKQGALASITAPADYETVHSSEEAAAMALTLEYGAVIADSDLADEAFLSAAAPLDNRGEISLAVFLHAGESPDRFFDRGLSLFCNEKNAQKLMTSMTDKSGKKELVLRKAFKKMRDIASSVKQGILIFDNSGRVAYSNKEAEEITGMSASALLSGTMDKIFSIHPYKNVQSGQAFFEQERHVTSGGRELILDSQYSATEDKESDDGHVLLFSMSSKQALDRHQQLELLQFQERYHSTQQFAAFQKQMLVIKDETSGTISGKYAFETYFKPLDVMSGDAYGSINVKDGRYFFYIVDAMGKGLSASVTAVQSTSFINHAAELAIIKNDFDMPKVIGSFTRYIRDRLMEEEALCAIFALLDTKNDTLSFISFGMPPVLLYHRDGTVESLRSQNMPIMRFMADRTAVEHNLSDVNKILIYSDGLSEAETRDGRLYFEALPEHFAEAVTKKNLLKKFSENAISNDDDVTFFYISKTNYDMDTQDSFSVRSSLSQIAYASQRIKKFLSKNGVDDNELLTMDFALGEMLMNALEHGSLGISNDMKKRLVGTGTFDTYIAGHAVEGSPEYNKEIKISCKTVKKPGSNSNLIIISIADEGSGFAVPDIFKFHSFDGNLCHIDSKSYNGRGIFITDNLVDGLFYNEKGNVVYILKVLDQ